MNNDISQTLYVINKNILYIFLLRFENIILLLHVRKIYDFEDINNPMWFQDLDYSFRNPLRWRLRHPPSLVPAQGSPSKGWGGAERRLVSLHLLLQHQVQKESLVRRQRLVFAFPSQFVVRDYQIHT